MKTIKVTNKITHFLILLCVLISCNQNKITDFKTKTSKVDLDFCKNDFNQISRYTEINPYINIKDTFMVNKMIHLVNDSLCSERYRSFSGFELFRSLLIYDRDFKNYFDNNLDHLNRSELKLAMESIELASKNDLYPESQFLLGVYYYNGKYLKRDTIKGKYLLNKAFKEKDIKDLLLFYNIDINKIYLNNKVPKSN